MRVWELYAPAEGLAPSFQSRDYNGGGRVLFRVIADSGRQARGFLLDDHWTRPESPLGIFGIYRAAEGYWQLWYGVKSRSCPLRNGDGRAKIYRCLSVDDPEEEDPNGLD